MSSIINFYPDPLPLENEPFALPENDLPAQEIALQTVPPENILAFQENLSPTAGEQLLAFSHKTNVLQANITQDKNLTLALAASKMNEDINNINHHFAPAYTKKAVPHHSHPMGKVIEHAHRLERTEISEEETESQLIKINLNNLDISNHIAMANCNFSLKNEVVKIPVLPMVNDTPIFNSVTAKSFAPQVVSDVPLSPVKEQPITTTVAQGPDMSTFVDNNTPLAEPLLQPELDAILPSQKSETLIITDILIIDNAIPTLMDAPLPEMPFQPESIDAVNTQSTDSWWDYLTQSYNDYVAYINSPEQQLASKEFDAMVYSKLCNAVNTFGDEKEQQPHMLYAMYDFFEVERPVNYNFCPPPYVVKIENEITALKHSPVAGKLSMGATEENTLWNYFADFYLTYFGPASLPAPIEGEGETLTQGHFEVMQISIIDSMVPIQEPIVCA